MTDTIIEGDAATVTRLHAIVRGHVQGVGFRFWAHHTAHRLGITGGVVRNLPDEAVEVEAEAADRAALDRLFHELHVGPTQAQVVAVEATWQEKAAPRYNEGGFRAE